MIIAKKKYHPFAFENTQNVVIFSVKVIFVEREPLVQVDLSKPVKAVSLETYPFIRPVKAEY